MRRFATLFMITACLGLGNAITAKKAPVSPELQVVAQEPGGGGGDDDKKKKRRGGGDDEAEIKAKKTTSAKKRARRSAKEARQAQKAKRKQITYRAKTRGIFHKAFNRKAGRAVNFRSKRTQRRYSRGRRPHRFLFF